jgi:hypothetical protein
MPSLHLARLDIATLGTGAGIALALSVLALHAALLPEAHWQGDDFICAAFARDGHLRYLWEARIGSWSPRPLSELIFYLYGRVAAALLRPLTVPFLALLWGVLVATTLVTLRRDRTAPLRILVGLATACLFLLGHPVAEMFFWPAGAVAYLSTLAATSLALFLLADGRDASLSGMLALSAALTACAASSEAGAIAAVPLALVLAATSPHPRRLALPPVPLLVAGFVLWTLAHHRMVSTEAVGHAAPLRHLAESLRPVPRALLDDMLPIWPARLCLVFGLRWCWTLGGWPAPARYTLPAFAGALLLAAAVTIAAGLFQFGTPCCQRHDSLRQCWVVLALAAMAIWSARWPARPALARLGPAALCLACLLGVLPRLHAIAGDFRLMHAIVAGNAANWHAGRDTAGRSMLFRLPPAAALAGPIQIPAGHYDEPALNSWTAHGLMHFFGKSRITIQPP